jgi:hypothetical protein
MRAILLPLSYRQGNPKIGAESGSAAPIFKPISLPVALFENFGPDSVDRDQIWYVKNFAGVFF